MIEQNDFQALHAFHNEQLVDIGHGRFISDSSISNLASYVEDSSKATTSDAEHEVSSTIADVEHVDAAYTLNIVDTACPTANAFADVEHVNAKDPSSEIINTKHSSVNVVA